jgi:hypothetical protein
VLIREVWTVFEQISLNVIPLYHVQNRFEKGFIKFCGFGCPDRETHRKAPVRSDRQWNPTHIRPKRMKSRIQFNVLTFTDYTLAPWRYPDGSHDACTALGKKNDLLRIAGNINRPRRVLSLVACRIVGHWSAIGQGIDRFPTTRNG